MFIGTSISFDSSTMSFTKSFCIDLDIYKSDDKTNWHLKALYNSNVESRVLKGDLIKINLKNNITVTVHNETMNFLI